MQDDRAREVEALQRVARIIEKGYRRRCLSHPFTPSEQATVAAILTTVAEAVKGQNPEQGEIARLRVNFAKVCRQHR